MKNSKLHEEINDILQTLGSNHNSEMSFALVNKLFSYPLFAIQTNKIEKLLCSDHINNRSKTVLLLLLKKKKVDHSLYYKKDQTLHQIIPIKMSNIHFLRSPEEIMNFLSPETWKNAHKVQEIFTIINDYIFDLHPNKEWKRKENFYILIIAILYFINNKFQQWPCKKKNFFSSLKKSTSQLDLSVKNLLNKIIIKENRIIKEIERKITKIYRL